MIKLGARQTAGSSSTTRMSGQVLHFRCEPPVQAINFDDSPAGPTSAQLTIAAEDWSDLFNAVQERLTRATDAQAEAGPDASPATQARLQAIVRECVEALQQLHDAQKHTLARSQHMALAVFDTRTELAQLRAELSGTKAREQQARHQAQHDSLTQLPNRDHFGTRLEQATSEAQATEPIRPQAV